MRIVEVVPYDPRWPALFEAEARRLRDALGANVVEIHHVGSTAVPGLAAKPVLDILPVVSALDLVDEREPEMTALGYRARGEAGIAGRRYFVKDTDGRRTHHVHAYRAGHPAVARHLDFRDYLRAHPAQAERYASLKVRLAERFRLDAAGYTEAKRERIEALLEEAARWLSGAS